MSRRKVAVVLPVLVALVLSTALAASVASANGSKDASATMEILTPVTLGGTQISPGTYSVTADDSKVTVRQKGKMIAEASVQWKDENVKAKYTNIVTVGDQVTEIHFGGKMRYIAVTREHAAN
jgi:hypothetical protein